MTQQEKIWILSLPTEMKIILLQEAYAQNFGHFMQLSKLFLDTPITDGGLSTETIDSILTKVRTNPSSFVKSQQPL